MIDSRFSTPLPAPNLDYLRHLFSFAVLYEHAYNIPLFAVAAESRSFSPISQAINIQVSMLAVYGFFVISGFCIAYSMAESHSAVHFYWKRILRIQPEFLFMVLGIACFLPMLYDPREWHWAAWLCGSVASAHLLLNRKGALRRRHWLLIGGFLAITLLLLQHGYRIGMHGTMEQVVQVLTLGNPTFNWYRSDMADTEVVKMSHALWRDLSGAVWTIRFEELCYIALMALGFVVTGKQFARNAWVTPVLYLATVVFGAVIHANGGPDDYEFGPLGLLRISPWWFNHFIVFSSYFLGGVVIFRYRASLPVNGALVVLSAILIALCTVWDPRVALMALPVLGTYFVMGVGLSLRQLPELKWRGTRMDLSYGIYLWHCFVIQILLDKVFIPAWGGSIGDKFSATQLLAATIPLTLALAYVSWTCVGAVALRFKNRYPTVAWKDSRRRSEDPVPANT